MITTNVWCLTAAKTTLVLAAAAKAEAVDVRC
jgi:hypothetical protein